MTTGFDIDELERLLAAATGSGVWSLRRVMDRTFRVRTEAGTFVASGTYEQDAALIVAARNSLPALLTEIRELRAENARLKGDGGFLLARLGDLEWHDGAFEQTAREYFGHVEPAIERFRATLGDSARAGANVLDAKDTEIRELRAENARLKKLTNPTWFYHPDYPEYCKFDPSEVIDEDYDPLPGVHVFEIHCAVALPSIWCAVYVSNDPDADERFTYTEHASEAEARAALGEPQ